MSPFRFSPARGALALVLLAGIAAVLAACAPRDAQQRTTVRFWAIGREGEVLGTLLPEFEAAHPDIRVDLQQIPSTAAHEKLLTAFAADTLPDVCQLGNTWICLLYTSPSPRDRG